MSTPFFLSLARTGKTQWEPGTSLLHPGRIAAELLPGTRGGQMFASLFRRFGYPNFPWDDRKNLASYLLSTPERDVIFYITPYMGGDTFEKPQDPIHITIMFGCYISRALYEEEQRSRQEGSPTPEQMLSRIEEGDLVETNGNRGAWIHTENGQRCVRALTTAIGDLLRPVYVRDIPITCRGRIHDEEHADIPVAPTYASAGIAVPEELFASAERYSAFFEALMTLGKRDFACGMRRVIELAQKEREKKGGTGDASV